MWLTGPPAAPAATVPGSVGSTLPLPRRAPVRNPSLGAASAAAKPLARAARWAVLGALVAVVLALIGLARFAIPPAAESAAAPTDAVVVLTGGSQRLHSGIDLLREGKGRMLFVTGVGRRVDLGELLRAAGEDTPRSLVCCIALGHEAENTAGNALETARWMRRQGYHSLRLVTAWYHMPRSLLEFERAMPGIRIVPHPVFPERVREEYWWAWRGTAALLIGEYEKYLAALFQPMLWRSSAADSEPVATEARR
jgi:uncharacterized SAM-binding protein YcdF (DUF218 family)